MKNIPKTFEDYFIVYAVDKNYRTGALLFNKSYNSYIQYQIILDSRNIIVKLSFDHDNTTDYNYYKLKQKDKIFKAIKDED